MRFKRAVLTEPGKMALTTVEEAPGRGQVLLKIASCGLCSWELGFFLGELNIYGYPHKLGHEFAGTVVQVGEGCTCFNVGDPVSGLDRGFGGFAEYRVIDETKLEKLGSQVDPKYALGEPQKCIVTVLRAAAPEAGDHGIVLGCGPMGLWCVQALAGNTLGSLTAVDVDPAKLDYAESFGATDTVNPATEDVIEKIREITGGRMADFVIEGTGSPALLDMAQEMLSTERRSRLILMSSHHVPAPEFDFRKAIARGLTIVAAHPPYSRDGYDDFRRAVTLINRGVFRSRELISHEFPLSSIQEAFETLREKPHDYIKGIVVPD
ncbi:MAG: zinc-binding dehydrogenase [Clostridiales Family XIII bacterium]|jgi:threonine dehydrogenase-like Zn-dependent dehydrogenase|nr:zinc-binding dehydrogenase [Clostridiales Family XIII bacterium]